MKTVLKTLCAGILFCPALGFSARQIESDLGPVAVVERTFTIDINECAKNYKVESQYIADCDVVVGDARFARLLRASSVLTTWNYNSGEKWNLYTSIYLTTEGYRIHVAGEPPMPADRIPWASAQRYVAKAIEQLKSPTVTVRYLRPKGDLRNDEKYVGPLGIFSRTIQMQPGKALFAECEKRLSTNTKKRSCAMNFVSNDEGDSVVETNRRSASNSDKSIGSLDVSFNAFWGWQYSGPVSSAMLGFQYDLAADTVAKRQQLFNKTLQENKWNSTSFLLHRVGLKPKKTSLYSDKLIGDTRIFLRQFDIDKKACVQNWKVATYQGFCEIPLNFRGLRLADNIYAVQGLVKIGNDSPYLNVVLVPGGYRVEVFAPEHIVKDFKSSEKFIDKLSASLPDGYIYDVGLVW